MPILHCFWILQTKVYLTKRIARRTLNHNLTYKGNNIKIILLFSMLLQLAAVLHALAPIGTFFPLDSALFVSHTIIMLLYFINISIMFFWCLFYNCSRFNVECRVYLDFCFLIIICTYRSFVLFSTTCVYARYCQ